MLGGEYVAACTNASRTTKRAFDADMKQERAAHEAATQAKEEVQ